MNHLPSPLHKIMNILWYVTNPSLHKSRYLHALYTNMFDDNYPHEKKYVYHALHSSHHSFYDETLNDKPKQEECPTLINQSLFLIGIPSMTHNVIDPSQYGFLEHVETQFDINKLVFDDYFSVPKLNVSANLSFVGPTQSNFFLL
jgi:hypothetical protein